jgi:hypothetical protein
MASLPEDNVSMFIAVRITALSQLSVWTIAIYRNTDKQRSFPSSIGWVTSAHMVASTHGAHQQEMIKPAMLSYSQSALFRAVRVVMTTQARKKYVFESSWNRHQPFIEYFALVFQFVSSLSSLLQQNSATSRPQAARKIRQQVRREVTGLFDYAFL